MLDVDLPQEVFEDDDDLDPPDDDAESPGEDDLVGDESDAAASGSPRKKRRKRRPPVKSPAHEARIEEYRALVETRGWIFAPPTPEQPISFLFDDLTVKQIVTLGTPGRHELKRRA